MKRGLEGKRHQGEDIWRSVWAGRTVEDVSDSTGSSAHRSELCEQRQRVRRMTAISMDSVMGA
jgi:hypothetical protein